MNQSIILKAVAPMLVAAGTFFTGASAQADTYDHLDRLALQVQSQSRALMDEFRLHYRHTREYRHLMSDALQMYRHASHIHELAHNHGSLYHLQKDLDELGSLHHHLHDLVDHRDVHPHGGHADGDTSHVHELLSQMEDSLHHMRDDVRSMRVRHHGSGDGHSSYERGRYEDRRPNDYGGRNLRFGNNRISSRFGW